MARVNIEERCFAENRIRGLALEMGWTEHHAMGVMVYLWHGSQEALAISGSKEDIQKWSFIKKKQLDDFIKSAIFFHFLECLENGQFLIVGNQEQIKSRLSRIKSSSKGGEATKAKWQAKTRPSGLPQVGSIQFNSIQSNTTPTPSKGHDSETDPMRLAELWNQKADSSLPRVKDLDRTQRRYRMAQQRLKSKPDLGYWAQVIERINQKPFYKGENDRGWKASFEYLVRTDTHAKLMEEASSEPKRSNRKILFGDES